jgi:hypothetical protein
MTLLNFLAGTLLANRISSSAKLKPPVSGIRNQDHRIQSRPVPTQKKPGFGLMRCRISTQQSISTSNNSPPVPRSDRDHVRVDSVEDDTVNDIDESAQCDRLGSKATCRNFVNNGIAYWAKGAVEGEIDQSHDRPNTRRYFVLRRALGPPPLGVIIMLGETLNYKVIS